MLDAAPNRPEAPALQGQGSASARSKGRRMLHLIIPVMVGAVLGYGYHRLVGCRTGTCPITANPYISTIYGAVMGFLLGGGGR